MEKKRASLQVTEKTRFEEQRAMVSPVQYGCYVFDTEDHMRIIQCDVGFTEIMGYTAEDVEKGKLTYRDITFEPDYIEIIKQISSLRKEKDRICFEHRACRKDGNILLVYCYGVRMTDDGSGHETVHVVITDVSRMKQQSRDLEAVLASISCGIIQLEWEHLNDVLYVNHAFAEIMGYSTEKLTVGFGELLSECMNSDELLTLKQMLGRSLLKDKDTLECDLRFQKKDGLTAYVKASFVRIVEDNIMDILQCVITDVTQIVSYGVRYNEVVQHMQSALMTIVAGEETRPVFDNELYYHMIGYTKSEYLGQGLSLLKLVHPEDRAFVRSVYEDGELLDKSRIIEYRIIRKDGSVLWLQTEIHRFLGTNGYEKVQTVSVDITDRKNTELELRKIQEEIARQNDRRRIWEFINDDIIFEYDFSDDCLYYPEIKNRLRTDVKQEHFLKSNKQTDWVHPLDLEGYLYNMFQSDISDNHVVSYEFRIRSNPALPYIWQRCYFLTILDESGKKDRLIGRLIKIDQEKQQETMLEEHVKTDIITGLYNETSLRNNLDAFLCEEGSKKRHAFILIELNNYSKTETVLGSIMMDSVLVNITNRLKKVIRSDDILGRAGCDKFVLFMKNITDEKAKCRAREIETLIRHCYIEKNRNIDITANVGVAFFPQDGINFNCLFHGAAQRLGEIRESGSEYQAGGSFPAHTPDPSLYDKELVSFALRILAMSKDESSALNLIFERAAKQMDLNRIFVLEAIPEPYGLQVTNLWEDEPYAEGKGLITYYNTWNGFDPFLYQNKIITYDDCTEVREQSSLSALEDAKSLAFSVFVREHEFIGSIVFLDNKRERKWTEFEEMTLKEITNVISPTLFSIRKQEEQGRFLIEALDMAEKASRSKNSFLSKLSHELRTPMNAIIGMTDIIKKHSGEREKVEEYTEKLEKSSLLLLGIINDCLDISKIERGEAILDIKEFRLASFINDIAGKVEESIVRKHIAFDLDCQAGNYVLSGDRDRIERVLLNVIFNSVRFTEQSGEVSVTVKQIYRNGDRIVLRFQVTDNGIGMDEEFLRKIFEPFSQADITSSDPFTGGGLGMAVCKGLVTLMQGAIRVKSKKGEGTQVTFEIPMEICREPEEEKNEDDFIQNKEVKPIDFYGKRILLAEDNSLNAEIAKMILEEEGFIVECVGNGKKAVDVFKNTPAFYYSVILMDIRMPLMDGWEAARTIRDMDKDDSVSIPIVAMTANAFNEDVTKSFASGMNNHISKPIDRSRLFSVLSELLT